MRKVGLRWALALSLGLTAAAVQADDAPSGARPQPNDAWVNYADRLKQLHERWVGCVERASPEEPGVAEAMLALKVPAGLAPVWQKRNDEALKQLEELRRRRQFTSNDLAYARWAYSMGQSWPLANLAGKAVDAKRSLTCDQTFEFVLALIAVDRTNEASALLARLPEGSVGKRWRSYYTDVLQALAHRKFSLGRLRYAGIAPASGTLRLADWVEARTFRLRPDENRQLAWAALRHRAQLTIVDGLGDATACTLLREMGAAHPNAGIRVATLVASALAGAAFTPTSNPDDTRRRLHEAAAAPNGFGACVSRAAEYRESGQIDRAITLYTWATDAGTSSATPPKPELLARALDELADCCYETKQYDRAYAYYLRSDAIPINDDGAPPMCGLASASIYAAKMVRQAQCLEGMHRYADATLIYYRLIPTGSFAAQARLLNLYNSTGQLDDLERMLDAYDEAERRRLAVIPDPQFASAELRVLIALQRLVNRRQWYEFEVALTGILDGKAPYRQRIGHHTRYLLDAHPHVAERIWLPRLAKLRQSREQNPSDVWLLVLAIRDCRTPAAMTALGQLVLANEQVGSCSQNDILLALDDAGAPGRRALLELRRQATPKSSLWTTLVDFDLDGPVVDNKEKWPPLPANVRLPTTLPDGAKPAA